MLLNGDVVLAGSPTLYSLYAYCTLADYKFPPEIILIKGAYKGTERYGAISSIVLSTS
ncbi:MAG: hypothetical protein VZR53_00350 [Prevotella sp.]|nr:hypothetical protein [Prevotella sp.]